MARRIDVMGTSLPGCNARYARFVEDFGVPFAIAGVASVTLRFPTGASGHNGDGTEPRAPTRRADSSA
jgi:hypothetical protein